MNKEEICHKIREITEKGKAHIKTEAQTETGDIGFFV